MRKRKGPIGLFSLPKPSGSDPIKAVKESELLFSKLFHYANDVILIFSRRGDLLDANREACKIIGTSRINLIRGGAKLVLPKARLKIWEMLFKKLWKGGNNAWTGNPVSLEGKQLTIDFHSVKVSYDGIEVLFCIGRDVTEKTAIENELRAKEDALKVWIDAVKASIIPMAISNLKGYISFANKAFVRAWGYRSEDEVKRIHASNFWADRKEIYRVVAGPLHGKPWSGEMLAKRKDGSTFWAQGAFSVVKGIKGSPNVILGSFKDVTSKKQAEEVLKRDKEAIEALAYERSKQLIEAKEKLIKEKRRSDLGLLARAVAHEMRNPLSVMQVAIYNILRKSRDRNIKSNLLNLQKKIVESERIIRRALFFTRAKDLEMERIDIPGLIRECVSIVRATHPGKKVTVESVQNGLSGYFLYADRVQMKELLTNIMDNSIQSATGDKCRIRIISDRGAGGRLNFNVLDNGCGINKADIRHIFDPFFTKGKSGSGLGMPVCKEIVKLHHGKIAIKSEVNKGTKVTIQLPKKNLISRKMSV